MTPHKSDVLYGSLGLMVIYTLARAGCRQLPKEEVQWQRAASLGVCFLNITEDAS